MLGANADQAPPLLLPMSFFVTGLLGVSAALLTLLTHLRDLSGFVYGVGPMLGATHFITLGFVSMVMMGAMYQLVPVVLNTQLYKVAMGAFHYAAFVPGVALLVSGFLGAGSVVLVVGGSLVVASVIVFLINMGVTLRRTPAWGTPGWFVATAIGYLALTITMGWLLAFNFLYPFLPVGQALPVHLALGGVGWFTFTLMGVSYKLFPMFSLTHAKPRHPWTVYGLLNGAIWIIGVASWWLSATALALGALLAVAGLGLYLADVWRMWRKRLRRDPDPAMYLALAGAVGSMATVLAALAALQTGHWVIVFFLFFFGWIATSILGYLQKIVPFLVWLHRYSRDIGRVPVPRMKEILRERWTWQVGSAYLTGLAVATLALATGTSAELTVGLSLMLAGGLWLLGIVVYVLCMPPTVRQTA
jgi:hypothetical protein